jgi:hypothetical protein
VDPKHNDEILPVFKISLRDIDLHTKEEGKQIALEIALSKILFDLREARERKTTEKKKRKCSEDDANHEELEDLPDSCPSLQRLIMQSASNKRRVTMK